MADSGAAVQLDLGDIGGGQLWEPSQRSMTLSSRTRPVACRKDWGARQ